MDFKQIQDLIKLINKSDLSELKLEQDNFKITLRKETQPSTTPAPAKPAPEEPAAPAKEAKKEEAAPKAEAAKKSQEEYLEIKSPMIGTFYRSPSPDKDPFVKVGDVISKGDHICIIEAMKLFNEIEAEVEGKVMKVLVEDATPVEYDQPLFLIDPS